MTNIIFSSFPMLYTFFVLTFFSQYETKHFHGIRKYTHVNKIYYIISLGTINGMKCTVVNCL